MRLLLLVWWAHWTHSIRNALSFIPVQKHLQHRSNIFAHSDGHSNTEDSLIFNPVTKEFIKQTSTTVNDSTWFQLIHQKGGFIVHAGVLMPIDLEALIQWECTENNIHLAPTPSSMMDAIYNLSPYSEFMRDETWSIATANPVESNSTFHMESTMHPSMDELLFIQKPTKMLTLPGIGIEKENSLASEVNSWLNDSKVGVKLMALATKSYQKQSKKLNGKRPRANNLMSSRPCHRLDFDTSGVVAIGLTPDSHRKTSIMFENRNVTKTYIALVAGHVQQDCGVVSYPVGKVPSKNGNYNEFACYTGHNGLTLSDFMEGSIREAETEYIVTNRFTLPVLRSNSYAKYTRIVLKPRTGRGHQLRLHLAAIGHPILGDTLHSESSHIQSCTPRLCLHAEELYMTALMRNKTISMIRIESIAPF